MSLTIQVYKKKIPGKHATIQGAHNAKDNLNQDYVVELEWRSQTSDRRISTTALPGSLVPTYSLNTR